MAEKKIFNKRWVRIAQHIAFWLVSYFVMLHLFKYSPIPEKVDYIYTALFHMLVIPAVYLHLVLLLPRLNKKKGWVSYIPFFLLLLALFTFLNYKFFQDWSIYVFPDYYFISYYNWWEIALIYFIYITITSLIKSAKTAFVLYQVRAELEETEKQKVQMELKALKSQINPHFLFNTLNGIYSMALDRDNRLPDTVLQLSDLMRYFLYEAKDDVVPLQKELQLLDTYIALQKLRLGDDLRVDVIKKGEVSNQKIAPLLLITFLENAFKHGDKSAEGEFLWLEIIINKEHLYFKLKNKKGPDNLLDTNEYKGLGLDNIRRRLELIYPGDYSLDIQNEDVYFIVELDLVMHEG